MKQRLKTLSAAIGNLFKRSPATTAADSDFDSATASGNAARAVRPPLDWSRLLRPLSVAAALAAACYVIYTHPPLQTIERGEIGIRVNQLTGNLSQWQDGSVLVLPGLHEMRSWTLRDQTYRPAGNVEGSGAPLQSLEGLSLGVDLSVRYALDGSRVAALYKNLPDDIGAEIVEPKVQGVIYKVFARYTVREIFSSKRAEIQKILETELTQSLNADGVLLRAVQIGKVGLPADYKRGMEGLLAEELASEKMRYTLELKDKRVKEVALDAEAEKVRREKTAEAAGREQIIAARSQEEAMKHVLPFKQRQIEQRQFEAEAERVARVKQAEGSAQARRIEAGGEAEARQKLADAEVYRLERVGKTTADQMQREGLLVTRHPLLIQKTMADKLSDKIQVIIAAPPTDGSFIGNALLGGQKRAASVASAGAERQTGDAAEEKEESK